MSAHKAVLALTVCLFFLLIANAQGQSCNSAEVRTLQPGQSVTLLGDTRPAAPSEIVSCLSGNVESKQGAWYLLNLPTPGLSLSIRSCGSCYDTLITVFEGSSCSALSCTAANDDSPTSCPPNNACDTFSSLWSNVEFCASESQYWLFVSGFSTSAGTFEMTVSATGSCAVPTNSECSAAEVINISELPATVVADISNAPGGDQACGSVIEGAHSMWYTLEGTGGLLSVHSCSPSTNFPASLAVFTGSCGSLACLTFDSTNNEQCPFGSQAFVSWCSELGETYYVFVASATGEVGTAELTIEAGNVCSAADSFQCSGAAPLVALQSGNTNDFVAEIELPLCDISPIGNTGIVWFRASGDGREYSLDLCGSSYDTVIAVFSGSCNDLQCVAWNDDYLGCGLQSNTTVCTSVGTEYFIAVGGFDGAKGNYVLEVNDIGPCIPRNNALCSEALPSQFPNQIFLSTLDADPSTVPLAELVGEVCSSTPVSNRARWYTVTGTGGDMTISTCGSCMDTVVGVWSYNTAEAVCGDMHCVAFNDDTSTCDGLNYDRYDEECTSFSNRWSSVTFCSTYEIEYVIMVAAYGFGAGEAILNIDYGPEGLCAGNDECYTAIPLAASDFGVPLLADTLLSTGSNTDKICEVSERDHSVWYRLEGTGNEFSINACMPHYDHTEVGVIVFSSTVGGCRGDDLNVCVGGANINGDGACDESETFCSVAGESYWIMLDSREEEGYIDLVIDELGPCTEPENSLCRSRTRLATPGNLPVSVSGSTVELPGDVLFFLCDGVPIVPPNFSWFSVIGSGRVIHASLCNSDFDTVIGVFEGPSCEVFPCIDANDDSCDLQSEVEWCAITNVEYMILVSSFAGDEGGSFTLELSDVEPCSGTEPCLHAAVVPSLPFFRAFDSSEMVSVVDISNVPITSCVGGEAPSQPITKSRWFKLIAPSSRIIHAETCGSDIDTILAVYRLPSQASNCLTDLQCVVGNDNTDSCTSFYSYWWWSSLDASSDEVNSATEFCAVAGETYYVMVAGQDDVAGPIILRIEEGDFCDANVPVASTCPVAYTVPELPFTGFGDTSSAAPFVTDVCYNSTVPLAGLTWYTVSGVGRFVTASVCNSLETLHMTPVVYGGDCGTDQECISSSSFGCATSWCSLPDENYNVVLMSPGAVKGPYEINISLGSTCIGPPRAPQVTVSEKTATTLKFSWAEPSAFGFEILYYSLALVDSSENVVEENLLYSVSCPGEEYCSYIPSSVLTAGEGYTFVLTATNRWGESPVSTTETATFQGDCSPAVNTDVSLAISSGSLYSSRNLLRGNVLTVSSDAILHGFEFMLDPLSSLDVTVTLFQASDAFPLLFQEVHTTEERVSSGPRAYYSFPGLDWRFCKGYRYFIAIQADYFYCYQDPSFAIDASSCVGIIEHGLEVSEEYQDLPRTEFWDQPELHRPTFAMRYDFTLVATAGNVPDAPAISSLYASASSVTVHWEEPCGHGMPIESYTVSLTPASGAPAVVDAADREHIFFGLAPSTEYRVSVVASTSNGDSTATSATVNTLASRYNLEWAAQSASDGSAPGTVKEDTSVAVDSLGNSCVAGTFEDTIVLAEGVELTSARYFTDCFVARYDSTGAFLWAVHVGQSDVGYTSCNDVAIDSTGDCYVVGEFEDSITFGTGGGATTISTESPGAVNMFLAKFSTNGALLFSKHIGDDEGWYYSAFSVTVQPSTDMVVAVGVADGVTDTVLYEDGIVAPGEGNFEAFVAVWNPAGVLQSYDALHGGSFDDVAAFAAAFDSFGDLYITGVYDGVIVTDDFLLSSFEYSYSIYAAKISLAPFNVEWLVGISGGEDDFTNAIAVGPTGDFVFIGGYHESAEMEFIVADANGGFDEDNGHYEYWEPSDVTPILGEDTDPFYGPLVVALNGATGEFVWMDTVSLEDNDGSVRGLAVLPSGNVVAGGEYYGTIEFTDPGFHGEPFVEALVPSAFLIAYDGATSGLVWSRWIGSANSQQILSDLSSSSSGLLMATGFFEGSASLDCSTTVSATVDGLQELFVAQYSVTAIPAAQPQPPVNICGPGTLSDFTGALRFPATAGESYPNGVDCFWLIEPFDVYHVLLDVTLFDLMGDDYVVFYDGATTEAEALVRYNGRNARVRDGEVEFFNNYNEASQLRVFGTQEALLVHFHSDACLRGYGIEFSWQSAPKAIHCDNDFPVLAVLEEGFVSESPVGGYRAFADCLYVVQPTFDVDFIVAEFLEFALAFDDCVSFYDGVLVTDPLLAKFCGNDVPFPIQATSRELLVRFQSNGINYDDGWVLEYRGSKEQEYCFGTDTVSIIPEDGPVTFQSHASDADYQPIANCGWEVEASGAVDSVYMFFESFDVPSPGAVSVTMDRFLPTDSLSRALSSNGLTQTTVEVNNALVNNELQTLYVSESNTMHLQFEAGGSLGAGFEAVVCAHPAGGACEDQVFTSTEGEFDNHFCAQFYEGNADCNWDVVPTQPDLEYVMLAFSNVDMRQNPALGIVTDYVEVFEAPTGGMLTNVTGNSKFYDNNDLPVVVSKEGMSVHFVSDALVAGEGFDAIYCSEYATRPQIPNGCEGASVLSAPQGNFHNHFCGGVHAANASCSWAVDAKSSGSTAMVIVRNLFFANEPFTVPENVASTALSRNIGPSIANSVEPGWGDNLHIYVDGELFRTFNRGGEFDDKTPPPQQEDGTPFELPIVISFVLTDIRLEFVSNDAGFVQGFDGTYCIFGPTDARICAGNSHFAVREGSLHSRACDGFYQADANCNFSLAPEDFVVGDDALVLYVTKADFNNANEGTSTFNPTDYLRVFDGPIVAGQFLLASYNHSASWFEAEFGENAFPFVHTTVKDTLTLQFVTDSQLFAEGFEAEYCTVARPVETCGGETQTVSGESGTLRDRTCGPTFVSPMDCRWRIDPSADSSVEPYSVLVIVFTRLDIGSVFRDTWSNAFVRIRDGATEEFVASSDPRHSNFQEPQLIEGSAAFVVGPQASALLDFEVQAGATLLSGWEVDYFTSNETGVCEAYQTFTEPTGYVEDHRYGLFYQNDVECEFLVQVTGAESISVQFETFELERGFDFLEVYDGPGWEANLIGFFTGDELPQSFSSTGDSLYFVFSTDSSVVGGGFRFYYSDSSLLECPLFCSGRGTCVSAVEGSYCDCDAGRFGSGCEIPPSPVLREARLSDGLEQLVLTFNLPSNRASMNQDTFGLEGSIACEHVLDTATISALGDGPSCVWRDSQNLLVKFGNEPTLNVGDSVGIIGGVITHPNLPEPTTAAMQVLAEGPVNERTPTIVIVAPSSITPGEDLVLDGRSSFLDGGRPMTFVWSVQICLEGGVSTTSASRMAWARHSSRSLSCGPAPTALQSAVSVETGPVLTISASAFAEVPLDHLVQFFAVGTNFVGTSSPATPSTVLYTAEQLPQVYLLGPRARQVRRAEPLLLRGRLALPLQQQNKRDVTASDCSAATFRWSMEQCSESLCPTLDEETRESLQLFIAPESLSYGHNYTLRLDVTFVEEVGQPTTSSFVDLHVADLALQVAIAGGDRVLSRQRSLTLSAEILKPSTVDLPQGGSTVVYRWNCRQQSGHACTKAGGELLVLQDTESLQLGAESLPPGDYFFSVLARVNVTNADGEEEELSSSDRVSLRILRRDQTEVRLRRLGGVSDRHNPRLPLALAVAVGPTNAVVPEEMILSRTWSVADGDISLVSGETTLSEDNSGTELVLAPRVLNGGAIYRFRVDATEAGLLAGEAELSVEVNAPPSGGRVLVFPSVGDSTTPFRFQASGATDSEEDMPLTYIFGVVPADCTPEERVQQQDTPYPTPGGVCPFVPLSNQLDVSSFEAFLPGGSYYPAVEVMDRLGASSRFVSQSLLVVSSSCPSDMPSLLGQLNVVVDAAEVFLCIGDYDGVRQLVNVASSALVCVDFAVDASAEQLYSGRLLPLLAEAEAHTATTELYLDSRLKSLLHESRVRLQRFSSKGSRAAFLEDLRAALAAAADLGFARDDGAGAALKSLSRALEANIPLDASDALTASLQSLARGALRERYCNNVASLLQSSGVRISARRRSSSLLNGETLSTPSGAVGASPTTFTLPLGISNSLGGAGCFDYAVTQFSVSPYRPAVSVPQLLLTPTSDLSFSSGDGSEVSVSGLEQPIAIALAKSPEAEAEAEALPSSFTRRCAFWDATAKQWSSEGCQLVGEDDAYYYVEASHLTSFSVLFDGGGGGGGAAPPITISSFGTFAEGFTGQSIFDPDDLDQFGNLVSSFTQFSLIPQDAFETSDTVYQLLQYSPGDADSVEKFTWDVIASMALGGAAVICVIAAVIVLSIPPIRKTLDGSRARQQRSQVLESSRRQRELELLREPSTDNYFAGQSQSAD